MNWDKIQIKKNSKEKCKKRNNNFKVNDNNLEKLVSIFLINVKCLKGNCKK